MHIINGVPMYYFSPIEFYRPAVDGRQVIDWTSRLDQRLLILLDSLRHQWGKTIRISRGAGTIGRLDGTSQHSIALDGICRAIDVIPGVSSTRDALQFYILAKNAGFTGIGCYPEWHQGVGFHLDTRTGGRPGSPDTWGMVGGQWVDINTAMHRIKQSA
jgi:hypothetical protein